MSSSRASSEELEQLRADLKRKREVFEEESRIAFAAREKFKKHISEANRLEQEIVEGTRRVEELQPPGVPVEEAKVAVPAPDGSARTVVPPYLSKLARKSWTHADNTTDAAPDTKSALYGCTVVLVRVAGPTNLGQICRACANFGVSELRLVSPGCEIDCTEARRFASHATDILLKQITVHDSVGTSARVHNQREPFMPEQIPALLRQQPAEKYAIVFGNEANGLLSHEIAACQWFVYIPTVTKYNSFNLSHAVAITLYTVSRGELQPEDRERAVTYDIAKKGHLHGLMNYFVGTVERFDAAKDTSTTMKYTKELCNQMHLSTNAANFLFGILKKFNVKAFGDDGKGMSKTGRAPGAEDSSHS